MRTFSLSKCWIHENMGSHLRAVLCKIYQETAMSLRKEMKFSIKDLFSKCDIFTEEILNGKLHFLCSTCQSQLANLLREDDCLQIVK